MQMLEERFKMKLLIIPFETAEKIRQTEFPKPHKLAPVKGLFEGKEVYFLPVELKENELFKEVLKDFEACEVKEIETIEEKYFDSKDVEILPTKTVVKGVESVKYISKGVEVDPMTLISKTVLTETIKK
jgi:hypothetical protein